MSYRVNREKNLSTMLKTILSSLLQAVIIVPVHSEALYSFFNSYGGDTQSRNLYKKLVQVNLTKKLDHLTWFLIQGFSCTSFLHRIQQSSIPYKKLACT